MLRDIYRFFGILNVLFGLAAIAYSVYLALFMRASYTLATITYANPKVAEAYEVAKLYSNLRFFTVLTIGLSAIYFGYKAVEIKIFSNTPIVIHWTFFASSLALDILTVVGMLSDIGLRV